MGKNRESIMYLLNVKYRISPYISLRFLISFSFHFLPVPSNAAKLYFIQRQADRGTSTVCVKIVAAIRSRGPAAPDTIRKQTT